MSKLSDILNKHQGDLEEKSRCTVTQFAEDLHKSVEVLLDQFSRAKVDLKSADDLVLESHKKQLIDFLKSEHFPEGGEVRKKITIKRNPEYSPYGELWRAVGNMENGAEWDCLNQFSGVVLFGENVHPHLQRLVNLIVAKAIIQGALPLRKLGRPKEDRTETIAMTVATLYWRQLDAGLKSSTVVEALSKEFHKTERQIFRYVEGTRGNFGETSEARRTKDEYYGMIARMGGGDYEKTYIDYLGPQPNLESLTGADYLDHLDEVIVNESKKFPDVKDLIFMDSDKNK